MAGGVAYAGAPQGRMPVDNVFSFSFSQPFKTASDFVPPGHIVPQIEGSRKIFVDNKSGRFSFIDFSLSIYLTARHR
jgi:hypothetical protein